MADFEKVGLLTFRDGRILLCKKNRVTSRLILPGGCIEPGETPLKCLERELREELGPVTVRDLCFVGAYEDIAHADDPSVRKSLRIQLYMGTLVGEPVASREIVELVWLGPDDDVSASTPIFIHKILPDIRRRGLFGG